MKQSYGIKSLQKQLKSAADEKFLIAIEALKSVAGLSYLSDSEKKYIAKVGKTLQRIRYNPLCECNPNFNLKKVKSGKENISLTELSELIVDTVGNEQFFNKEVLVPKVKAIISGFNKSLPIS